MTADSEDSVIHTARSG